MVLAASNMAYNDSIQRSQPLKLDFVFPITAAKTVSQIPGTLTAFDAIASQAIIDAFLATSSEFLVAAFDATSMGTDAFAVLLNLGGATGQCKEVTKIDITSYTAAGAVSAELHLLPVASLTSTSLTSQIAKGASGNVALRMILTGVDALTSGHIHVEVYFKPN